MSRDVARTFWHRRDALIAACVFAAGASTLFFAGSGVITILYHLLTDGLVLACWLFASWGIGVVLPPPARAGGGEGEAKDEGGRMKDEGGQSPDDVHPSSFILHPSERTLTLTLSRGERGSERALRHVTAIAVGLGILSLITLGLGLAGWLNQSSAIAMLVAGIAGGIIKIVRNRNRATMREPVAGVSWLWLLAMPFLGIAVVAAFVPPGILWGDEPNGYDVVEYHLQIPREWYELGRIVPLEHNVFSYFPFNVEMHDLLAMHLLGGPFDAMYLAQMMHVAFGVLAVIAVYAVVRSLTSATSATIAGVACAAVPWTTLLAPIAYNESGLLLYGTLAIGWALKSLASRRATQQTRDMLIAGAMAGFAAGVKLTAIPILFIALPLAIVIVTSVRARKPADSAADFFARSVLFVAIGAALFSPWAIRNAMWTHGNPIFPEGQSLFGRAHFSEVQSERWKRAHSPREEQRGIGARLRAMSDQIVTDWRFGYFIIPLGIAALALSRERREGWALIVLLGGLAVFWIGFTHLQGRFFVLAIPICAMLIGLVQSKHSRAVMAGMVAISAVVGFVLVAGRWNEINRSFAERANGMALTHLLGFDQLDRWDMLGHEKLAPDQTLVLVGDAEAFMYQVPMKQLRYRTVFDVDASRNSSAETAWTEGIAWDERQVYLIDSSALQRFHETYWGIPMLSPSLAHAGQAFVVSAAQMKAAREVIPARP